MEAGPQKFRFQTNVPDWPFNLKEYLRQSNFGPRTASQPSVPPNARPPPLLENHRFSSAHIYDFNFEMGGYFLLETQGSNF